MPTVIAQRNPNDSRLIALSLFRGFVVARDRTSPMSIDFVAGKLLSNDCSRLRNGLDNDSAH